MYSTSLRRTRETPFHGAPPPISSYAVGRYPTLGTHEFEKGRKDEEELFFFLQRNYIDVRITTHGKGYFVLIVKHVPGGVSFELPFSCPPVALWMTIGMMLGKESYVRPDIDPLVKMLWYKGVPDLQGTALDVSVKIVVTILEGRSFGMPIYNSSSVKFWRRAFMQAHDYVVGYLVGCGLNYKRYEDEFFVRSNTALNMQRNIVMMRPEGKDYNVNIFDVEWLGALFAVSVAYQGKYTIFMTPVVFQSNFVVCGQSVGSVNPSLSDYDNHREIEKNMVGKDHHSVSLWTEIVERRMRALNIQVPLKVVDFVKAE